MGFFGFRKRAGSRTARAGRRPTRVRPPKSEPVEVQVLAGHSIDILHARDISVTGVGVYVTHAFEGCEVGAAVELVVTLPGARSFLAQGVVAHRTRADDSPEFVGIEFTEISDPNRARIRDYVTALERR